MSKLRPKPRSPRAARRSLRYEATSTGRVIVGSMWLPVRIVSDTRAGAEHAAMQAWAGTLPGYGE